jgi:hypothetical protein
VLESLRGNLARRWYLGSGGGIGRRAGFRFLWGQPREGSSPSPSISFVAHEFTPADLTMRQVRPVRVYRVAHVLELVDRLV